MSLYFQVLEEVINSPIANIPEDPDYYLLIRWIVGSLLAVLATMIYMVRYMFKRAEALNEIRVKEKDQQIADLKKLQDDFYEELKHRNESIGRSLEGLINTIKNGGKT